MASINVVGLEDEQDFFDRLAQLPDDVQTQILEAQGKLVLQAIRQKGQMYRVRDTGGTLDSLKRGKVRRDKRGDMSVYVRFEGRNARGVRYAEIAFVNNYGKAGQPARPFVTQAVQAVEQAALDAAAEIYNDWVDTQQQKG